MPKLLNTLIIATVIATALAPAVANQLPSAGEIEKFSRASATAFDTFITETFLPRAQLEYSGRFINTQDPKNISDHAKTTCDALTKILQSQLITARIIEEYEGDDWDKLYGGTALWRTSVTAARQTRWRICVVDYHHGIASTGIKKEELLKKVISQTSEKTSFSVNEKKLLNTRARWAAATGKNSENTIRRLDSLIASSNIDNEVFYQAVIMRMKLSARTNAEQLTALADTLKKGKLNNNFELLLKLALEELKIGGDKIIKSIASKHPVVADFSSQLILASIISNAKNPQLLNITLKTKTPAEARLAAFIAIKEKNSKYAAVFKQMSSIEKFQCSEVYLAAAESCRKTEPLKALGFYLEAIKKTKTTKDSWLKDSPSQIARRRARLAYGLYYDDSKYYKTAKEAIELYMQEASNDQDKDETEYEELTYLYASMLIESGDCKIAAGILKKIAAGGGNFQNAARLDLIFCKIKNSKPGSPQRKELINALKIYIDKHTAEKKEQPKIKTQALNLYSRLLLEEGGPVNAAAVLKVLEGIAPQTPDTKVIKAAAQAEIKDIVKAIETLANAIEKATPKDTPKDAPLLAAALTAEILEDIDEYEDKTKDFAAFTQKCYELARYSERMSADENQREGFQKVPLELSIIKAGKGKESTNVAQYLLKEHSKGKQNDIDYMRCRARLYMNQGRFAEALKIWTAIARARKPRSHSADKPKKWWRAKYYALECYSKISDPKNNDLNRAIKILTSTNKNIPKFWKKKLTNLKDQQQVPVLKDHKTAELQGRVPKSIISASCWHSLLAGNQKQENGTINT